jgi:hypothetical protein
MGTFLAIKFKISEIFSSEIRKFSGKFTKENQNIIIQ